MMRNDVIVIRGAPGTGKSTIARCISERLSSGLTIEVDSIRQWIHKVDWNDYVSHRHAILAATNAAKLFLAKNYRPIIIVDTLGFGHLELATSELGSIQNETYSLICSDAMLRFRLLTRVSGYRNVENAIRFNQHVRDEGSLRPVIDTTWRKSANVAAEIMEAEKMSR